MPSRRHDEVIGMPPDRPIGVIHSGPGQMPLVLLATRERGQLASVNGTSNASAHAFASRSTVADLSNPDPIAAEFADIPNISVTSIGSDFDRKSER